MAGRALIPERLVLKGESLNWVVRQHPTLFYAQDWYRAEAFAGASIVGVFTEHNWPWPSAACAAAFVRSTQGALSVMWWNTYVWTRDVDAEGHRIYVGRAAQYGGLQIHRLLTPEIE